VAGGLSMLKTRLAAAHNVRDHFVQAEGDQDLAAISAARCVVALLEARQQAKLPLATGLAEIALVARGAALALEARHCFIEAHPGLALLPSAIGIPERAWGDGDPCPTEKVLIGAAEPYLRSVA